MRSMYVGEVGRPFEDAVSSIHLGWPRTEVKLISPGVGLADIIRNLSPGLVVVHLSSDRSDRLAVLDELSGSFRGVLAAVSEQSGEADVIEALDMGADDYFALPLNKALFVARVRAALRRVRREASEASTGNQFGQLVVDSERREASVAGRCVPLTPTEFRVLGDIAARGDLVASKEALCEDVWGPHTSYEDAALRKHIQNIRRKLRKVAGYAVSIETVPGVGYRLVDHREA
jgi:two-component system KDP operon response regulator KdpE